MKRTIAAAILLLLCIPSVDSVAADDIPPPTETAGVDLRDPAVIEKGMEMLSSTCGGYCHGSAGKGMKGPALRNRTDLSIESLHRVILNGRKQAGKIMPAWEGTLTEQEIWTTIAAIVSLRNADGEGVEKKDAGH